MLIYQHSRHDALVRIKESFPMTVLRSLIGDTHRSIARLRSPVVIANASADSAPTWIIKKSSLVRVRSLGSTSRRWRPRSQSIALGNQVKFMSQVRLTAAKSSNRVQWLTVEVPLIIAIVMIGRLSGHPKHHLLSHTTPGTKTDET